MPLISKEGEEICELLVQRLQHENDGADWLPLWSTYNSGEIPRLSSYHWTEIRDAVQQAEVWRNTKIHRRFVESLEYDSQGNELERWVALNSSDGWLWLWMHGFKNHQVKERRRCEL